MPGLAMQGMAEMICWRGGGGGEPIERFAARHPPSSTINAPDGWIWLRSNTLPAVGGGGGLQPEQSAAYRRLLVRQRSTSLSLPFRWSFSAVPCDSSQCPHLTEFT